MTLQRIIHRNPKCSIGSILWIVLLLLAVFCSVHPLEAQRKNKRFTVVIDAGHGGKDTGATAGGVREKDINLAVAIRVKNKIAERHPEVKIIMTRNSDVFIPLNQRARIANTNKADLFISIHTNSAKSTAASGAETYVLGLWRTEDNLRVAMRENKVIELEDNYEVTYHGFDPNSAESYIQFELMKDNNLDQSIALARAVQSNLARLPLINRDVRQAGFLVIREISMPGILVELGFVSNAGDRAFLASNEGRDRLADAITRGFSQYYSNTTGKPIPIVTESSSSKSEQTTIEPIEATPITGDSLDDTDETFDEPLEHAQNTELATVRKTEKLKSQRSNEIQKRKNATEYRIQLASIPKNAKKLKVNDPWFRKLPVKVSLEGNRYVYTVGSTYSLAEAKAMLKKYRKSYKDAYIAVYKNNRRESSIH